MVKWLIIFIILNLQQPIKIEGQATVKKIEWQDGKIIAQKEYGQLTNFTISEADSTLILGVEKYKISKIITTDSVVTYNVLNVPDKEYVYNYGSTLTQKNVKWRSHGLETWFVYELMKKENNNEFEFGG